jgi:hypothetical protein
MTAVFIANLTAATVLVAVLIAVCRRGFVAASEHPHNEAAFQPETEAPELARAIST